MYDELDACILPISSDSRVSGIFSRNRLAGDESLPGDTSFCIDFIGFLKRSRLYPGICR